MSWLQGGLGRLLHSREQQKPTSAAAAPPPAAAAAATAGSLTRAEKQKGMFSLLDKLPSPRSLGKGQQADAAQMPLQGASPQQLLDLTSPGSIYAQLPCIQQLRPSRAAADELAAAVLAALPGVQLDSSWVVFSTVAAPKPASGRKAPAFKAGGNICILPALEPPVRPAMHLLCPCVSVCVCGCLWVSVGSCNQIRSGVRAPHLAMRPLRFCVCGCLWLLISDHIGGWALDLAIHWRP
jgi:hypothetical protein